MNDTQMISISITVFAILAGSLFNNIRISDLSSKVDTRINDMRDVLRSEMKAIQAETKSEMKVMQVEMNSRFDRLDAKRETLLNMAATHEGRLTALEGKQ